MAANRRPISLPALLLLTIALHFASCGRWYLRFHTADNWMAGYVGQVNACLTFHPSLENADPNTNLVINLPVDESPRPSIGSRDEDDEKTPTDDEGQDEDEQADASQPPLPPPQIQEECVLLPWRHFERGRSYGFSLDLCCEEPILRLSLVAECPQNDKIATKVKTKDQWHVSEILAHNLKSSEAFTWKPPTPQVVPLSCSPTDTPLRIEKFSVSKQPRPCVSSDGNIYADGEKFDEGCSAHCSCTDGEVACVSMCPPFVAPDCRYFYVPGECCQSYACDNEIQECMKYEERDCETTNRTVDSGAYPWSVFIKVCPPLPVDNTTQPSAPAICDKFCSGTIIGDSWILTAVECVSNPDGRPVSPEQVRVIAGEQTVVIAEDAEVELPVLSVTLPPGRNPSIALIKLKEPIVFDRGVQPILLPTNKDQCSKLTEAGCSVSVSGWVNVGSQDFPQYELYQMTTYMEEDSACGAAAVPPSRPNRRRRPKPAAKDTGMCVSLVQDEPLPHRDCGTCFGVETEPGDVCVGTKSSYLCSGERGRGLVGKLQTPPHREISYLVGVISYQPGDEKAVCKLPAHSMAVSVCPEMAWIESILLGNPN